MRVAVPKYCDFIKRSSPLTDITCLLIFRYDNVPPEINRLRCRVNYHALKFLPEIEQMADLLASRMRNRTGSSNPYMYITVAFEKPCSAFY